ncbi:Na+-transporting methylmalonyl-CoA/oxaloacetate decarboxylase subunit beta [Tepidanaerobacter sp. GT38]|uniref:sodium ion-translocating decarboxylase subunit beta n=1 Tax=Tepidanaerobacter sp. GT38 TaxID=2722793 RepID=UPI001F35636B|nr:sodium ion-translocating decarboxylase subunit beta [Tepidanaerobacter sp. GT38]MCG1011652.1 Na+-transporting methylmalonyl-CoA/oxaloacetate decarboxylase subunit beta [Tepidanaerobacter sp. GT38]
MRVYYSNSIWTKGWSLWGWPQRTNWQFEHAGIKRYIPYIYRFSKGIVFDVITILDEAKLKEFFEKYETADEGELTPLQRCIAEHEYPYQDVAISKIWINGKRIDEYSSSCGISIPWLEEDKDLKPMRRAYSFVIKKGVSFACERYCVPYPEADTKLQKLLRFLRLERVNQLKLATFPLQQFHPLDIHFKMSLGEMEKEICFTNPVTGEKHTLYFQNAQSIKIPFGPGFNRQLHIMQSMYEIEPALPQGHSLQFDSSMQYKEEPEVSDDKYKFSPAATSSIGIIGGADGPTSVFISSKGSGNLTCGAHGLPLYTCFSVPSFQEEDTFHFHLEGINEVICDSKEIVLQ